MAIETVTEPVLAWRGYSVARPGLLVSQASVLMPRERAEAVCREHLGVDGQRVEDHAVPEPRCSCGFYAARTAELLCSNGYWNQDVLAEVWMWGRVVVYSDGFRSQYVYPRTLYAQSAMGKRFAFDIGDMYGVPVLGELPPPVPVFGHYAGPKARKSTSRRSTVLGGSGRPRTLREFRDVMKDPSRPADDRREAADYLRPRLRAKLNVGESDVDRLGRNFEAARRELNEVRVALAEVLAFDKGDRR